MRVATTGSPAASASMNAMPNGSPPVFGWQWMSAAARRRRTSVRSPSHRSRSAMPRRAARARSEARYSASCGRWALPATQHVQSDRSASRPSASSRTACPFHGSRRLVWTMTVDASVVSSARRSSWRSVVESATASTSTGFAMTAAGTRGYIDVSAAAVYALLQIARSGTTRLASRSVQWRPVTASCAQNTSGTPARRTTPPKNACDQAAWQMTPSNDSRARRSASARRARRTASGRLARGAGSVWSAMPVAASSRLKRPSKQSATLGSSAGHTARRFASVTSTVSMPPKRLPE